MNMDSFIMSMKMEMNYILNTVVYVPHIRTSRRNLFYPRHDDQ
jgi:hypothetical protein